MDCDFTISVCICTRNRPDDLNRCLQSICDAARMPDQVIVSDDGDDDNTVEKVAASFSFVDYQRGPRIGLGANRNACIASVTSNLVSFIDDDVILSPTFVEDAIRVCRRLANSETLFIVTGIEYKHTSAGVNRIEPGNPDFWGYQRLAPRGTFKAIVINSAVFPARLFTSALFDPQLKYGSEEIDMARHAISLGYKIFFEPALHVDHYPSEINRGEYASFIDASRMYATAKNYWNYQQSFSMTLFYALFAPPKLVFSLGRRHGLSGVKTAIYATIKAYQYFRARQILDNGHRGRE